MSAPLVTIILTVFRRTEYLREAIESALGQTVANLELIVTDDANSPSVQAICGAFPSDGRLRYRANQITLGAPLNIAAALREARGEYVTILNDDDVMERDMLEKLIPPLETNPCCVASFGDHWVVDAKGNTLRDASLANSVRWGRSTLKPGPVIDPFGIALRGCVPFVMGTVFRKASCQISWLAPEVAGAYDQWLALRLAKSGGAFYFCADRVFRYRAHAASESARVAPEKAQCQVHIFSMLLREELTAEARLIVKRNLAHFLFVLGRDRLYFGRGASARNAFTTSLKEHIQIKAVLAYLATYLPGGLRWRFFYLWRRIRGIEEPLPSVSCVSNSSSCDPGLNPTAVCQQPRGQLSQTL